MFLQKLTLINFKNYEQADFSFCPKINGLIGPNGVGKTNILDAIHYLSLCKSCQNPIDSQNIRYDCDFFMIQGEYTRDGQPEKVSCSVKSRQKKIVKRNKKEYDRLSDHIGLFPLVMVSPMDNSLIVDGSEERRRFMNEVISQYDPSYLQALLYYNRTLVQRNAVLKQFAETGQFQPDVLDVFNEQLASWGNKIFAIRTSFCETLIPIFQHYYSEIAEDREAVTLSYHSALQKEDFLTLLQHHTEKDCYLQYTTAGIHRDDLYLHMNGYVIKRSASQGQQKTFLVALKLANYEFIRKNGHIKPLLLLDDIFDKFDARRVKRILDIVSSDDFGQVFITDTEEGRINPILQQTSCPSQIIPIGADRE